MFYPRGEEVAARAAGAAGTIYMLSTLSGCRLEDVKSRDRRHRVVSAVSGRRPRRRTRGDRARAQAAGYSALVVTIDTPVAGMRERDVRNGVEGAAHAQPLAMLPFVVADRSRGRDGSPDSSATAA